MKPKYIYNFFDHIKFIIYNHFDIPDDLAYIDDINDNETHNNYFRDLIFSSYEISDVSIESSYIYTLASIPQPIISVFRTDRNMVRLEPRIRAVNASDRLENCAISLAMEAYKFKERIRSFGKAAIRITSEDAYKNRLSKEIGRIVKVYSKSNKRILSYRNFSVHNSHAINDEFSYMRANELGAIILHDDLWFEYKSVFKETQSEWHEIALELKRSMKSGVKSIQLLNEKALDDGAYTFISQNPAN